VARRQDKTVIGGHQRLLAARRLGLKQVLVVFLDLSPEQARLLNLGLNRIGGTWDQELLARLLAELKDVPDVDLSLSGFSEDELKKYLKGLESREKRDRLESFDLAAALEAARTAPVAHTGDLWLLGDHRLLCGDATDSGDVARLVGEARANMGFSDPPYNVSYGNHGGAPKSGRRRSIQNDDLGEGFYEFLLLACRNLLTFTEGAMYVCMSSSELHTRHRAFVEAGATGPPSLSGPRAPLPWAAPTTSASMSPSSTAGGKGPGTTGAVTGTRETCGTLPSPQRVPCTLP
jgi:hypothetical protein